mmetsp:Transcript_26148/g.77584  ORF Transcript_26148/g.77584 Transcript_26148/m.77584 type:complete len:206 (+) Transcript_26148:2307-2924(+)
MANCSALLTPRMAAMRMIHDASDDRIESMALAIGRSHPSIFIASAPWMTSLASRTRSSVRRAVCCRMLATGRTSAACSGMSNNVAATPANAGRNPSSSDTISSTMPSSSGPATRKIQNGIASSKRRTSLDTRLTTWPALTLPMDAELRRSTLPYTAAMTCCRMMYPWCMPIQKIWWCKHAMPKLHAPSATASSQPRQGSGSRPWL